MLNQRRSVIGVSCHLFPILVTLCSVLMAGLVTAPQERDAPGRTIGKVSVMGNLILMELDKNALGEQNLFDVGGKTLRFTPGSAGYRVETVPLRWDAEFGQALNDHQVALHNFSF